MNKSEYIASLRELADYIEAREFPDDWQGSYAKTDYNPPCLSFWVGSKTTFGKICSLIGTFEKNRGEYSTGARAKLPGGATISVSASREVVCKKVLAGTKTIPAKEEEIIPAQPEHEEEIYKWECPESFISLKDEVNV